MYAHQFSLVWLFVPVGDAGQCVLFLVGGRLRRYTLRAADYGNGDHPRVHSCTEYFYFSDKVRGSITLSKRQRPL